jgi:hypothetical protein
MYKNEKDKLVLEEAMKNDVFYYRILHLAAAFNQKKRNLFNPGRQPFDWRLCEKVFKEKGELTAAEAAKKHNMSVAKVYKIWQNIQPSHEAYFKEFGVSVYDNPNHYVEWLKKEL